MIVRRKGQSKGIDRGGEHLARALECALTAEGEFKSKVVIEANGRRVRVSVTKMPQENWGALVDPPTDEPASQAPPRPDPTGVEDGQWIRSERPDPLLIRCRATDGYSSDIAPLPMCTRPKGHAGDHASWFANGHETAGRCVARWPASSNAAEADHERDYALHQIEHAEWTKREIRYVETQNQNLAALHDAHADRDVWKSRVQKAEQERDYAQHQVEAHKETIESVGAALADAKTARDTAREQLREAQACRDSFINRYDKAESERVVAERERDIARQERAARTRVATLIPTVVDMLLFCPNCNEQHIDSPDGEWTNPPHRTHQCKKCDRQWRPSETATNGVARIGTLNHEREVSSLDVVKPHFHKWAEEQAVRDMLEELKKYRGERTKLP